MSYDDPGEPGTDAVLRGAGVVCCGSCGAPNPVGGLTRTRTMVGCGYEDRDVCVLCLTIHAHETEPSAGRRSLARVGNVIRRDIQEAVRDIRRNRS